MNDNKLFALTATFDNPDKIIHAAEKVSNSGYEKYDIHTPYPVHGMDNAMKLSPSKIGYFTISIGLTFMSLMIYFIYWTNNVDYPNIIGGKPFFALPTYVPIMFEVTILTGAVLSVAILLIFYFKFPNNAHPLHDTQYMKDVSSDKFGVCIEATDSKFNESEIKTMFENLGAVSVLPVYYDTEEVSVKHVIFEKKFVGGLIFLAIFTSVSVYMHMNKLLYIAPFDWMLSQSKLNAQERSDFFADGRGMRTPPEGTVARGFIPYMYAGQPDSAGVYMSNPTIADAKNLEIGKNKYNTYCSPCHGYYGEADSRLRGQFPNPPSLHSEKLRNWTDGRIYAVIVDGQNVMPSYASQITRDERWAVVNYIRTLQRSLNAKEEDLK